MRKIGVIAVTVLLLAIVCLQVLAALNIFPRCTWVEVCPVNAISMQNGKASIDATICIGCRRCVAGTAVPASKKTITPLPVPAQETQKIAQTKPAETAPASKTIQAAPDARKAQPASSETVKAAYSVDPEKCIGCGLCTIYCPEQAITMVGDKAVIDPQKCTNCGICKDGNGVDFKGCPTSAINSP